MIYDQLHSTNLYMRRPDIYFLLTVLLIISIYSHGQKQSCSLLSVVQKNMLFVDEGGLKVGFYEPSQLYVAQSKKLFVVRRRPAGRRLRTFHS